jgi:alcohol dehydrogenase class IV
MIVFGEGALDHLATIQGRKALIVTDQNIAKLGYVELVQGTLRPAGIETAVFAEVEPNPSLQTLRRGAQQALSYEPDWIIGLGGGSCMDAAKSIWIQYERPDLEPDNVAPMGKLGLRQRAHLIAIPTTSAVTRAVLPTTASAVPIERVRRFQGVVRISPMSHSTSAAKTNHW